MMKQNDEINQCAPAPSSRSFALPAYGAKGYAPDFALCAAASGQTSLPRQTISANAARFREPSTSLSGGRKYLPSSRRTLGKAPFNPTAPLVPNTQQSIFDEAQLHTFARILLRQMLGRIALSLGKVRAGR